MEKNKLWNIVQVFSVLFVVGTLMFIVFTLTEPVGGGVRELVSKPWWLTWAVVLMVIVGFFGILADVRRRNGGVINAGVIIQTFLYIGFLVGVIFLFRYLTG